MRNAQGLIRDIPVNVENQVREECGFGCAFCGEIFVHLHHFDPPFVTAGRHDPSGIIALCQLHHTAAENGELSLAQVRGLRANPIALSQGYSRQDIITSEGAPQLFMGASIYLANNLKFCVDTIPILWIASHHSGRPLTINAIFRDENFQPILTIRNNTVLKRADSIRIQKISNRYLIGDPRDPLLEFSVTAGNTIEISRFRAHGIDTLADILPTHVQTGRGRSSNNISGGFNAIFGQSPTPYSGQFVEESPFEWILNANGLRVGTRQGDWIFDLGRSVKAEIVEGNRVRRIYRKVNGIIVAEHATAVYRDGMIFFERFDESAEMPTLPYPLPLLQVVRSFDGRGNENFELCTSDFYCSDQMPAMMCGTEPFHCP